MRRVESYFNILKVQECVVKTAQLVNCTGYKYAPLACSHCVRFTEMTESLENKQLLTL